MDFKKLILIFSLIIMVLLSGCNNVVEQQKVLSDFDKKPASFYYMVSEKNELVQHTKQGGTFNDNLPILSTIVRYDVMPEKQSIVKENIPILTYPKEEFIPRVAISSDKKRLAFADVGILLFEPSSGYNKHFLPQENVDGSIDIQSGTINKMELASPVFSPDGERIAFFGHFYDEMGKESKKQVRILTISSGKYEVLIENISDYSDNGQQFWPPFAIYPVYWYKDNQGEKLLLEKREISGNARPLLTTGFLIHDFNKNTTSTITFFMDKDKPIADCPGMSNEFPAGRLSAECNSIPYYVGRSPNGQYMLLGTILDFSILENGGQPEMATIDFQACGSKTVWAYENGKFICSDFDFNKSALGKSAVLALEKYDSFAIPYVYRVGDVKSKSFTPYFEENVEYVVPAELKNKIQERLPKLKLELEKELKKSGLTTESPEYAQSLDYYLGFSTYAISTQLKSKIQQVIWWISGDRFVTLQSSFSSLEDDPYQEKPIKQTLFLTDLKGNKKIIGEHSVVGEITDQEQVFKKLEELKIDKKFIDSLKENKAGIVRYSIKQQIAVDFLGEVKK